MPAYYNENEPRAAALLRELIEQGHIAPGFVDERSIHDVRGADLEGFTQCHFFAGIGGWSLALRQAGWDDEEPVYTASCPCQPFSTAGSGLAENDPRHLWPVFRRLLEERVPAVVFGEQVASKLGRRWLAGVYADLAALDYLAIAADLCAAGVGAPHIRQRLYWMAYRESQRWQRVEDSSRSGGWAQPQVGGVIGGVEHAAGNGRQQRRTESGGRSVVSGCGSGGMVNAHGEGPQQRISPTSRPRYGGAIEPTGSASWSSYDVIPCGDGKARRVESGSFPLAHGVPHRVGLLRGYGNAIVPPVAAAFINACRETIEAFREADQG